MAGEQPLTHRAPRRHRHRRAAPAAPVPAQSDEHLHRRPRTGKEPRAGPAVEPRDPRAPPVGTVLRHVFNGIAHEVSICAEGFDYAGERFKTLSAIAKHITGTPWSGFLFFGLRKRVETMSEESAA